jgi:hypothetical protein
MLLYRLAAYQLTSCGDIFTGPLPSNGSIRHSMFVLMLQEQGSSEGLAYPGAYEISLLLIMYHLPTPCNTIRKSLFPQFSPLSTYTHMVYTSLVCSPKPPPTLNASPLNGLVCPFFRIRLKRQDVRIGALEQSCSTTQNSWVLCFQMLSTLLRKNKVSKSRIREERWNVYIFVRYQVFVHEIKTIKNWESL